MARAKKEFEQAGLEIVPYPVDFQVSEEKKWSVMDFLPQAEALRNKERGIKEILGRWLSASQAQLELSCFLKSERFFYEKTYILISAAYGRA
jgi:hypothetical protein